MNSNSIEMEYNVQITVTSIDTGASAKAISKHLQNKNSPTNQQSLSGLVKMHR